MFPLHDSTSLCVLHFDGRRNAALLRSVPRTLRTRHDPLAIRDLLARPAASPALALGEEPPPERVKDERMAD